MLLEAGADPNIETGGPSAAHCAMPLSPRSPQQAAPTYTSPTAGKHTYIIIYMLDNLVNPLPSYLIY